MISIEGKIPIPKLPRNLWIRISTNGVDWKLE
jgi:hypothetical protein